MLRQLADVKSMIERDYEFHVSHEVKQGHEVLHVAIENGGAPFMTISYDKKEESLMVNTELHYPDTFAIAGICIDCMRLYETQMGQPFVIVPKDNDEIDVLFGDDAYAYAEGILNAIEEATPEEYMEEADKYLLSSKKPTNKGSGGLH